MQFTAILALAPVATVGAMGLQGKGLKHPVHSGLRQAVGFRCLSNTPVGPGWRCTFQSTSQQGGHSLVRDGARAARPKLIVESLNAMLDEPLPPFTHRRLRPIQT